MINIPIDKTLVTNFVNDNISIPFYTTPKTRTEIA